MYELARKHCGKKEEWRISLAIMQKKCGSSSTEKEFRRLVTNIVEEDRLHSHMPDYSVTLESDMVTFKSRGTIPKSISLEDAKAAQVRGLNPETYHDARTVAPGWDVYYLEREWREWITETPRDPDAAFVGFCRKWYERRVTS